MNEIAANEKLSLDYGSIETADSETTAILVGDRVGEIFIDPAYFPMNINGNRINLAVEYGESTEIFTVTGSVEKSAETDVYDMTDYQKTVTLLYLIGEVLHD